MLDPIEMNNYYPFGMVKEGMFAKSGEGYRYGFNGMERDNETKGFGNDLDFGARLLDPRLARWKSVDPSAIKFPSMSPYNTFANNPILFIDPDGWEISMEAIMFNHTFPNGDLLEQHKHPIIGEYVSTSNFSRTADGQKYYDRYGFLPSELLISDLEKITGLNFRIGTLGRLEIDQNDPFILDEGGFIIGSSLARSLLIEAMYHPTTIWPYWSWKSDKLVGMAGDRSQTYWRFDEKKNDFVAAPSVVF
jgi:RHS repeat-associated protein